MEATPAQINYLEILFNDCLFSREERMPWIWEEINRDVKHLDELTLPEASKLIEKLKAMKYGEE